MAQKYIGITLPFDGSQANGVFGQTIDTLAQVRSNFKNLMLTKKGERVMQPNLGTDLHLLLFEPRTSELVERARTAISDAVDTWLPFLELVDVQIADPGEAAPNKLSIYVKYRFRNNANVTDSLTIALGSQVVDIPSESQQSIINNKIRIDRRYRINRRK